MKPHIFESTTIIDRPVDEVFGFFSRAENLDEITPPGLNFRIITPLPVEMKQGTLIEYRLRLNGVPFGWKTEISEWLPPHRFTDRQIKGPYVTWEHTHTFTALPGNRTQMTDRVAYLSPGWILEPIVHLLFVKRKVEQIFSFRAQKMKALFGSK